MGFFSQECLECTGSILASARLMVPPWLNDAVAIATDGTLTAGSYDGYGNLVMDLELSDERPETDDEKPVIGNAFTDAGHYDLANSPAVWHRACWTIAGEPREHPGLGSSGAADQGFFYDSEGYNVPAPTTKRDIKTLRARFDRIRKEMFA